MAKTKEIREAIMSSTALQSEVGRLRQVIVHRPGVERIVVSRPPRGGAS